MYQIDWSIFFNWVISGFIGVFMGAITGWITYRYQRNLDKIQWEREQRQRRHDEVVRQLTRGLDGLSSESIKTLAQSMKEIRSDLIHSATMSKNIPGMRNFSPNKGAGFAEPSHKLVYLLIAYENFIQLVEACSKGRQYYFGSLVVNYDNMRIDKRDLEKRLSQYYVPKNKDIDDDAHRDNMAIYTYIEGYLRENAG